MQILIGAIGRLKVGPLAGLAGDYLRAANNFGRKAGIGPVVIREFPESRARDATQRKIDEGARLCSLVGPGDVCVALSERGETRSSLQFASWLQIRRDAGTARALFLIGGPDGHDPAVLQHSSVLSLGPLTLPHGLARIVLLEQIYRAATVLAGHPYHRT